MIAILLFAAFNVIPQPADVGDWGGRVPADAPIVVSRDATFAPEAYWLNVNPDGNIYITSADAAGEFYARETLRQMQDWRGYPCLFVKDRPAYRWRGVLLDESRHFFGKHEVKRILDLMGQYKLNVLHWHLVDDQGWRLEVPGYPELVRRGAIRPQSPQHGARLKELGGLDFEIEMDGQSYGPFYYSESDVREILSYAAARHVTVVPEIELPGHVAAALAAYPEFACFPEHFAERFPRQAWGIERDVLCLGNDRAIKFMEDVLDYVCRIFPSPYVHIGGDECPQVRWKDCPKCRKRIVDEKLGDVKGLQPWATRHFVKFLSARGKRSIGWDEYLAGDGCPTSAVGMVWRNNQRGDGGNNAWLSAADLVARGHDLVMAPVTYCYINKAQGLEDDPYQYHGGCITMAQCHSFDPCAGIPEALRSHVLGGQAANWTEYTWCRFDLEWKMWPRTCALAEALWSGPHKTEYADFLRRMRFHRPRLLQQGVNCAPLE